MHPGDLIEARERTAPAVFRILSFISLAVWILCDYISQCRCFSSTAGRILRICRKRGIRVSNFVQQSSLHKWYASGGFDKSAGMNCTCRVHNLEFYFAGSVNHLWLHLAMLMFLQHGGKNIANMLETWRFTKKWMYGCGSIFVLYFYIRHYVEARRFSIFALRNYFGFEGILNPILLFFSAAILRPNRIIIAQNLII